MSGCRVHASFLQSTIRHIWHRRAKFPRRVRAAYHRASHRHKWRRLRGCRIRVHELCHFSTGLHRHHRLHGLTCRIRLPGLLTIHLRTLSHQARPDDRSHLSSRLATTLYRWLRLEESLDAVTLSEERFLPQLHHSLHLACLVSLDPQ